MPGMVDISIKFKQLANTANKRSEQGVGILIVRDSTKSFTHKKYNGFEEVDEKDYNATNLKYIKDVFGFNIYKLVVVRIDETVAEEVTDINEALNLIPKIVSSGRITCVGSEADYDKIIAFVKKWEKTDLKYSALVYKKDADDKMIENFGNDKVKFKGEAEFVDGVKYLPSMMAILCVCNTKRAATYYVCKNLDEVLEVEDTDAAIKNGQLVLINDVDEVKVARGVTSLTTITEENTEDMKYIDIVETMKIIDQDIKSVYKSYYVGKYKNKLSNQMLFINEVGKYYDELCENDILDDSFENSADINVEKQRKALITIDEKYKDYDDTKIRNTTYKRSVFLASNIKILGAMEDMDMEITMN